MKKFYLSISIFVLSNIFIACDMEETKKAKIIISRIINAPDSTLEMVQRYGTKDYGGSIPYFLADKDLKTEWETYLIEFNNNYRIDLNEMLYDGTKGKEMRYIFISQNSNHSNQIYFKFEITDSTVLLDHILIQKPDVIYKR